MTVSGQIRTQRLKIQNTGKVEIHRGLAYVCGGEPYGGEEGCGLFFCAKHLYLTKHNVLCCRCEDGQMPFDAKPDIQEWIDWKQTDPSWAEWRKQQMF